MLTKFQNKDIPTQIHNSIIGQLNVSNNQLLKDDLKRLHANAAQQLRTVDRNDKTFPAVNEVNGIE